MLSELWARSWGFGVTLGDIALRRFHDRVDCTVSEAPPGVSGLTGRILDVSLVDPVPVTGHDVPYPPAMHLARIARDGVLIPRIVQVDSEYDFRRADRGRPCFHPAPPSPCAAARFGPHTARATRFAALH